MRPTYEELFAIVRLLQEEISVLKKEAALLKDQNRVLQKENLFLKDRVTKLEERLKLNSDNSSLPPSQDRKKNKQAPKGGARPGHEGHYRKLIGEDQISKKVISRIEECPHCGSQQLEYKEAEILQQVDLPPIRPEITQIERERACCQHCLRHVIAPFPKGYNRTAFGPRLTTLVGMCGSIYRLGKRSTQSVWKTAFGIPCGLGSISAMEKRVSVGLQAAYEDLGCQVNQAKVAYVDETSFRQQAKTHYVWTVTTGSGAFLRILPSRGIDSLNQIRPRGHSGITVTDRYQVYAYEKQQYCLAHIRRDILKYAERAGIDGDLGKRALFEIDGVFSSSHLACRQAMQRSVGYRRRRLKLILFDALANGSEELSRFADRLLSSFHKLFLFTRYEGVESTNNAAERTLRHIVLWRKTSYGTQSVSGSQFLERSISIWMTLKKQGRDTFSFFLQGYQSTFDSTVPAPII